MLLKADVAFGLVRQSYICGVDETSNNETGEHHSRQYLTNHIEQDQTINIKSNIKIADIQFARVYILNGGSNRHNSRRPMVAKFEIFYDRETIRKLGIA